MLRFALLLLTAIIAKLIIDKLLRRRIPRNRNFALVESGPVQLSDDDLEYLARYTGVTDLDSLRSHVMTVWQDVKNSQHVYRCIQAMAFLKPRITEHPHYAELLIACKAQQCMDGGRGRPLKIVDLGCCFGQDTRQLLIDGISPSSLTAIDIHDGYWEAGWRLFKDDLNTSSNLAGVRTLFTDMAADPGVRGSIKLSLHAVGLEGNVSFVYALAVLHVLSRTQVVWMLKRVHTMLVPGAGTFFGWTGGAETESDWALTPDSTSSRHLHSQASLTTLLEEIGFDNVSVTQPGIDDDIRLPAWMQKDLLSASSHFRSGTYPVRVRLLFCARRKAV